MVERAAASIALAARAAACASRFGMDPSAAEGDISADASTNEVGGGAGAAEDVGSVSSLNMTIRRSSTSIRSSVRLSARC